MSACARKGRWVWALCLMREFSFRRLQPDALSYSALTAAFKARGLWRKALGILEEADPPTAISAALSACAVEEAWQAAMAVWTRAVITGRSTPSVRNAAVSALSAASQWELVLQTTPQVLIQSDDSKMLLVSAMSSLSRLRRWQHAMNLLDKQSSAVTVSLANRAVDGVVVAPLQKEVSRIPTFDAFDIRQRREVAARLLLRPLLPSCYPFELALWQQILEPAQKAFLEVRAGHL
ncbi:unnamed protein product [Durusdinium trenchii]|uniref:Uncharacterized protein n=1 Tax=Durusdinium trenchii TaxID=1381693 RepID=A0ABP0IPK3_9DINO